MANHNNRPIPRPGGTYTILNCDDEKLIGKQLVVTAYHGCQGIASPNVSVTGQVDGLLGTVHFEWVALDRVEPTPCRCPRLHHPHKRTRACRAVRSFE